jgi:Zn-dependent protease with chaperone function
MGAEKPTGLYGWIQSNDGRSLGLFFAFLLAMQVISAVNLFLPLAVFDPGHAPFFAWGGYLTRYAPLMFVGSGVWFAWEMFWHIETVKKASGFRFIDDHDEPRLCRIIEPLIMAMGLPVPFVGVIESPARNAFACGIGRKKAVVVVTRGLIDALDDEELGAVLAHELSHIKHGDIRLMAAANIFMTRLQLLHKNNALRFTPIHVVLAIAIPAILPLTLIGTFVGHLVLRSGQISRLMIASAREYIADAESAQLTKNPAALAAALVKVEHDYRVPTMRREDDAMMIAGDTEGEDATHPTVAQRIAALARTTGSMVFNAPGAIRAEQWDSSPTLTEARAAALLSQLPAAQVLPRVRAGSTYNALGMTRNAAIMAAVTIGCLLWIHASELTNPRAMMAKFDVRPLSAMLSSPIACQYGTFAKSAVTGTLSKGNPESCEENRDGAYKDFEGQKNTLAGWLADVSKKRKEQGFVHSDATLGNLLHDEVRTEYTGISNQMKGVYANMTRDGMFATDGTTFSSITPENLTIAELDQIGCFWAQPNYGEPKGHFSFSEKVFDTDLEGYLNYAQDRAENGPVRGAPQEDAWLKDYVEYRSTYVLLAYDNWGFPGLELMQQTYRNADHAVVLTRLGERLKDSKFRAGLTPMEHAQMRSLIRKPDRFVPCIAVGQGFFNRPERPFLNPAKAPA